MHRFVSSMGLIAVIGLGGVIAAEDTSAEKPAALPPAADRQVDFHKDVLPIFSKACAKCHGNTQQKGSFSINTRESLLKGGDSGEAVVVGKSAESRLIELVAGLDPDNVMPNQGPRLTADEVGLLRAWIDQGLTWEKGFTFRKSDPAPLAPRRPQIPAPAVGSKLSNPIDLLLQAYFAANKGQAGATVDDRLYQRRVSLDLVGMLPTRDRVRTFLADQRSDKRERLVDELLDQKLAYAEHWLTFWNDALRNDYRGTGYIDGGRREITHWLLSALSENMPYDRFVQELISPKPESAGFIQGIVWRGVVNASQVPPVQAAQNLSQVFLGINLKCASCHDSFVNDWKLADAYALANVFSDEPLEIHHCDKPTGERAATRFLYPELGSIEAGKTKAERQAQLATLITKPDNGRLARTICNRLWAQFFGRGLVEPVDDMDVPPWSADVLDYLAADLVEHRYDLKHTIKRIVTSAAYQMPAVAMTEQDREGFVFRGPVVRRMTGEQFVDATIALVGVAYAPEVVEFPRAKSDKSPADAKAAAEEARKHPRLAARVALANADPLLVALGRPNREQVVTERPKLATTLQALELTNGTILSTLLKRGAARLLTEESKSPAELVSALFEQALGRRPSEEEAREAQELVGSPPNAEGLEDLLWSLIMLPEFQLIY